MSKANRKLRWGILAVGALFLAIFVFAGCRTTEEPGEPVVKKAVIRGGGAGSKTYRAAFDLIDKKNPKVIVLCTAAAVS